ncbi:MAG: hypothetical protein AAF628_35190 [Planctomycetota bacterium]
MLATKSPEAALATTREPRPFQHLEPATGIAVPSPAELDALTLLRSRVGDAVPTLVRSLVEWTFAAQRRLDRIARPTPPSISVLNRRRRAATQWIRAILAGRCDADNLHALTHSWIPQLVGTGPDLHLCYDLGRQCFELLRGGITSLAVDRPAENMLPEAKAIHALDLVLAIHLDALGRAVERSRRDSA